MNGQHGKGADGIVRNLMRHASGASDEREAMDLNTLVFEYIDRSFHGRRAHVPELRMHIERDLEADVGMVDVVPQERGRVLLRLRSNAFDVGQEQRDPTVTVRTRRIEQKVELGVNDNAPGIPEAIREKMFEPFLTTKPAGSGTGPGLSLAHEIATWGHRGTLTVESIEGVGATFVVTLPAPIGEYREA